MAQGIFGAQFQSLVVIGQGIFRVSQELPMKSAIVVGRGRSWVELDNRGKIGNSLFRLFPLIPYVAATHEGRHVLRIELQRSVEVSQGSVKVALHLVGHGPLLIVSRLLGIQLDRSR